MSLKPPAALPKNDREFQAWCAASYDLRVRSGTGSPLNVVTADIGTLYMRIDGGANTTLYVKEAGNGLSTGWVAK